MKHLAFLAMLVPAAALAATPIAVPVKEASFHDADGYRVLKETVIVKASLDEAWKAFTTDDGFTRWAVPVAHITVGNGGMYEFTFSAKGRIGDPKNIRNRIDVYLPNRLIVMHNEFIPSGGDIDPAIFSSVRTMLEFAPVNKNRTRVTQTVIGFGKGAAYDTLYEHLRLGNAEYLSAFAKSFGQVPTGKSAANGTAGSSESPGSNAR